tara:strand:+ start:84 stop:770 length:687 start_codon:yes stop_codon:yes gene_type:complete
MKFIAEIGMNHNGNFDFAFELIKQAKISGADIAKFQLGWRDKKNEINYIDDQVINNLEKWCEYFEIELMFSIISKKALTMIKKRNFKNIKIASRTLKFDFDLAKEIISLNKNTFISLGMWKKNDFPFKKNKNIKYLWCLSKYPTEPEDLIGLPKKFSEKDFYGYSDHSIGIETCILAASRGADIIEKHFTLDKSDQSIRDHTLSATPSEFRNMVNICKDINKKINLGV